MIFDEAERRAWQSVRKATDYSPDYAIVRKWRSLKADGVYLGAPTTGELTLDDGGVAQCFSSGAILVWTGGDEVQVV